MNNSHTVLVLDDEAGIRNEIQEYLESEGHTVFNADRPSQAIDLMQSNPIDIALFDIRLPEMDGLTLLKKIKAQHSDIEIIMMTGYGDMGCVVDALRLGAVDFLNKPFKLTEIKKTINRIAKYRNVKKQFNGKLTEYDELLLDKINLVGESQKMVKLKGLIHKVAKAGDTTVLITGESGAGKELVARSIHLLSSRKDNKFIPVNCSSIPDELFENEFFGHEQGSYTDAKSDQKGLFEVADKGSLFLDEIGDMKFSMQAKLLRVIEEKKISRIGKYNERDIDVRIIAATNHPIEKMVNEGEFRKDLFHRLNLLTINIPPLRERKDDIPLLFNYFIDEFKTRFNKNIKRVEKSILEKLELYSFPGNVRELKHMVERAVILSEGESLKEKDFSNLNFIIPQQEEKIPNPLDTFDLNVIERTSIIKALKEAGKNKSKAARFLNISRQALDRKIIKYKIKIN